MSEIKRYEDHTPAQQGDTGLTAEDIARRLAEIHAVQDDDEVAHGKTDDLHRDVLAWTGLAPRTLGRVLRMQRALEALRGGKEPLAELAARAGYADQPHMTREIRRLTGLSPGEHRRVRNVQDGEPAPLASSPLEKEGDGP